MGDETFHDSRIVVFLRARRRSCDLRDPLRTPHACHTSVPLGLVRRGHGGHGEFNGDGIGDDGHGGGQLYEERPDKKRRAPAWCDRVLWRTKDAGHVTCVRYSRADLLLSDHKPVCAELSVKVCTECICGTVFLSPKSYTIIAL